jgi:hypothetical protein
VNDVAGAAQGLNRLRAQETVGVGDQADGHFPEYDARKGPVERLY